MKINLKDIAAINPETLEISIKALNLYPYEIDALDIYVTCEKSDKYTWLMTPSVISGVSVSKISIEIANTYYDIKPGFPGESSTNPIIHIGEMGHPLEGDYVNMQIEEDENINGCPIGTNHYDEDAVIVNIRVNDPSLIKQEMYPYGGNKVDEFDGFGGINNEGQDPVLVEGYGGLKPDESFDGVFIVIQKSQYTENGVINHGVRY